MKRDEGWGRWEGHTEVASRRAKAMKRDEVGCEKGGTRVQSGGHSVM